MEIDGWLRDQLAGRLRVLREATEPRTELDALLLPTARAPVQPPVPASVEKLATQLGLRDDERAIVAVLVAIARSPQLGRALGLLCDPLGRAEPTLAAITALLGLPPEFRITAEDNLARWAIVDDRAALDPAIEARLLGRPGRDGALVEHVTPIATRDPLPGWPVDAVVAQVARAITSGARGVRLWMRGPEGSGRRTFVAAIARALGMRAATVTGDAPPRRALRLAQLDDVALVWSSAVKLPPDLALPRLQAWLPDEAPPAVMGVADLTVQLPVPDRMARRAAWQAIVPAFARWTELERSELVESWAAWPGQLSAIGLAGVSASSEAAAQLRATAAQRLEQHCEILQTPFAWDDLVLPPPLISSLHELAHEARALPRLWEQPEVGRLFPHGRAVAALFCGPSGTGKTMAAQVIARELGLPLFRIDLSRLVSKYIGETSQNLARVLGAARQTDAVVFFDEADALFGKRTEVKDAHDRYANTDTDYLLQAIDSWPGVAILATNKRANIDAAFTRRLRTILEFPRADAAERHRLWTRLGTSLLVDRMHVLMPALDKLATDVELSGAQIKSALLTARASALHAETAVVLAHVLRGVERELEKEGRGLPSKLRYS